VNKLARQKRHLQGKSNDFFPWQVTEICEKWLILKGKGRKWAGIVWINPQKSLSN
jgi:hypothetical protein